MAELASLTRMPVRKLRYVFDHRVLPGLGTTPTGHGIPRIFTEFEGIEIGLAARLLDARLTRKVVATVLVAACRPARVAGMPAELPLYRACGPQAGRLEVGNGRRV